MDSPPCTLADVMAALARGASVLTGNQRAARTLRELYRSRGQESGQQTALSPTLMPWEAWIASLWLQLLQNGTEDRLLLRPLQERLVWTEVIAADESVATMRSANSLAGIAASAWNLLEQYGGRDQLQRMAITSDTEAFATWASSFERRSRTGNLLSASEIERELLSAIKRQKLNLPGEILLIGFEGPTPAQDALVDALRGAGSTVQSVILQHDSPATQSSFVVAHSADEELRAAVGWAKQMLERTPDARIAILVPDLEEERAEIDRILRSVLAPELQDIDNLSPAPYEFSLGAPLATSPMVATAMDLLRWTVEPLPLERISALLLSPYLGGQEPGDRGRRAEFDAFVLRQEKLLRPQLSLDATLQTASGYGDLAGFTRTLAAVRQITVDRGLASSRERGYGEWMEDVRELLRLAGWPGSRTLDSTEFQLRNKWEDILDQVAALDFSGNPVPFSEAIEMLERTLAETRFAPESHGAPVQVLGVLEAAGSVFDAVWFLRGSDESWPQQRGPHPLLPWQLQRSRSMPGTDAASAQQESRQMVARITRSASSVVFSYAAQGKDGPQHRSPIIGELAWPERNASEILSNEETATLVPVESIVDDTSLPPLPQGTIRGGESVLRLQAACGFRAFAERRLWATELDSVTLGMDGLQWGILLHDVIRRFWSEVRTQDALRAMSNERLRAQIDLCIEAAMKRSPRSNSSWDEAYLQTLRDRLTSLLLAWMPHELSRQPFEVSQSEEDLEVEVGPLRLTLRVDRIDKVAGGQVLIDYKTGNTRVAGWLGPRPDDPQLPLYAAFAGGADPLQAMAFAKLRAGDEMRLEGYDGGSDVIPKPSRLKTATLEEQLEEWRRILLDLAHDFAEGRTDVDPKIYPQTCRYCSQRILCRLDTSPLEEREEDGEAGENA